MTPPAAITEAIQRQKSVAGVRLDAYYKQLLELFEEIGVPETDWEGRLGNIWGHVVTTMQEEVEEEKRRVRHLTDSIEENGRQLLKLASLLGRVVDEPDENLSLLQLDRLLRERLQQLQLEKEKITAQMQTLRDEEAVLCSQLGIPTLTLAAEVPQDADFREMREHLAHMRATRQERQATFERLRQRLFPLLEALERCADGELETQVVWEADDCRLPLTTDNLEAMERRLLALQAEEAANKAEAEKLRARLGQLWARLEVPEDRRASVLASCTGHKPSTLHLLREEVNKQEELKRQNVEKFVRALRVEIAEMWEKCFYSAEQRAAFDGYHSTTFTEQLLEEHEEELERVRRYYETNRVLIKDVNDHQKLWTKMIELEDRVNDPARFSNRGGQLLLEEKERKKIARRLPKVESDLQQLIQRWESQHNATFRVFGYDFAAYIEQQKKEYNERKEQEREERANKKAHQLEHETMFGARPVTPAKRRAGGATERGSPSKHRRLESTRLGSQLRAASPGLGRSARTPLSLFNPASINRLPLTPIQDRRVLRSKDVAMARTAPGKLSARNVSLSSDMSYAEFTRGLRRLQAAAADTSPAVRASTRSRRRSQRLGGLPPAPVAPAAAAGARTPRTPRTAGGVAAKSPARSAARPALTPRRRSRLGLPALF
ncbi:protein regulator of cytokinesis 1-like isoform X1 [Amphibalanus amphitrite]|uniref:protein regulator of cytokinesis 1-like isoform X1 n=1 Tax=Amphibalanus amphitrite TaxID=1232801 RepID=UPI001C9197E9|nr:protein regulator of cytokinesis 1-like isoform X1 [Amphibalanus amphitrite]